MGLEHMTHHPYRSTTHSTHQCKYKATSVNVATNSEFRIWTQTHSWNCPIPITCATDRKSKQELRRFLSESAYLREWWRSGMSITNSPRGVAFRALKADDCGGRLISTATQTTVKPRALAQLEAIHGHPIYTFNIGGGGCTSRGGDTGLNELQPRVG